MGKIRKGRSEREDVSSIGQEWLRDHIHILTPRDIAMLKLLERFPVMTIKHLHTLTPPTHLKNNHRISAFYECKKGMQLCRDRIRKLYDYHFVNKYSPRLPLGEGTSEQFIWLDRAGYRFFELNGRPPKKLTQEYIHHQAILDVYCELIEMERAGEIQIDFLEACYGYKPKTVNIEPDIMVGFRRGDFGYMYLVEVDTGEKKESDELRKLDRYRDWQLGAQWIREEWPSLYKRKFPTVLYVCTGKTERKGKRRIAKLQEHADNIQLRGDFIQSNDFLIKIKSLRV